MAVKSRVTFTGLNRVLANLNREISGIRGRTRAGMQKAALIVQRRSMELTPVKTGNLRASAYHTMIDLPKGPGAEIGYTASYAPFVHEIDRFHNIGQWKFLETALKDKQGEVLEAIRSKVKV
ncbi:MAG TPA: HK97 gp10 family phage protein [candidate division Zixibacteria bacterium]|nr:HK97 gp10 family phage protein [candidate division Zixibacteria bacterium]HEQ98810.1 HK97 gp10 family phage protein [candidate division Zixibacteria bacterium]